VWTFFVCGKLKTKKREPRKAYSSMTPPRRTKHMDYGILLCEYFDHKKKTQTLLVNGTFQRDCPRLEPPMWVLATKRIQLSCMSILCVYVSVCVCLRERVKECLCVQPAAVYVDNVCGRERCVCVFACVHEKKRECMSKQDRDCVREKERQERERERDRKRERERECWTLSAN